MSLVINPSDKLILALDGMNHDDVFGMIAKLPDLCWVKVGLELFVREGPEIISELHDKGLKIFLDLKFHDIPVTMYGSSRQAARQGVEMMTVHACAGNKALSAAKLGALEGAEEVGLPPPILLAVTVLTSWKERDFSSELLISQPLQQRVIWLAHLACESGLGGFVCSPLEVASLRKIYKPPFELVTPGIRTEGGDLGDQSRTMSPLSAINSGSSRIVVGRPITQARDPANEFRNFCRELS